MNELFSKSRNENKQPTDEKYSVNCLAKNLTEKHKKRKQKEKKKIEKFHHRDETRKQ